MTREELIAVGVTDESKIAAYLLWQQGQDAVFATWRDEVISRCPNYGQRGELRLTKYGRTDVDLRGMFDNKMTATDAVLTINTINRPRPIVRHKWGRG